MLKFLNEYLTYTGYTITLHAPFTSSAAPVMLSIYRDGDRDNKIAELTVSDQLYLINLTLPQCNVQAAELFLRIYRCISDLEKDDKLPRTVSFTVHFPSATNMALLEEWVKSLGFKELQSNGRMESYRVAIKPTWTARCKYLLGKLK